MIGTNGAIATHTTMEKITAGAGGELSQILGTNPIFWKALVTESPHPGDSVARPNDTYPTNSR